MAENGAAAALVRGIAVSRRNKGGPPLSDDDRDLWEAYTKAVRRLTPRSRKRVEAEKAARTMPPPAPALPGPSSDRAALKRSTAPPPPAPQPHQRVPLMEQRLVKRMQRGRRDIDATLDLHGLTQAEAKPRLFAFLNQAQARGLGTALVITGKGGRGSDDDNPYVSQAGSGVLRRAVRLWLDQPNFRAMVVGYADAHRRHGGGGALYVQIRRAR